MKVLSPGYWMLPVLFFFSLAARSFAATYPPITCLSTGQGLSNNAVKCILQDHKGFMWFGTLDGLNRYDGYTFRVFRNVFSDSASLVNNIVQSIAEDKKYNLWIGTKFGISLYNTVTEKFSQVSYTPFKSNGTKKITSSIKSLQGDSSGNMLIGTLLTGFLFCEKGASDAIQIPFEGKDGPETSYDVQSIKLAADHAVWLLIPDRGLCKYDYKSRRIKLVNPEFKSASCLEQQGQDLLIGTTDGVFLYNVGSNYYHKIFDKAPHKLTSDIVANILVDKSNNVWVSTTNSGINIFNASTRKMDYLSQGSDRFSLSSNAIYLVFEDNTSRKWIGTLRGGINIIDPQKERFKTLNNGNANPDLFKKNFICSFYEDADSTLWIGSDHSGLGIWNRKTGSFITYENNPLNPYSISYGHVLFIKKDFKNNMWLATANGIRRFVRSTEKFYPYKCINPQTGKEDKFVFTLFEDHDKNLWAGTSNGGLLYLYNRQLDRFDSFDNTLVNPNVLIEDHKLNLWAGTGTDLVLVDKLFRKHLHYYIGNAIRALHCDHQGKLWLGTEGGGLVLFDPLSREIISRYTINEGLCDNYVMNILDDEKGNLWISTFNGLSKFDVSSTSFITYYKNDGLQSNRFNFTAALKLRSGEFAFGGDDGFNIFYPYSVRPANQPPTLLLTSLQINGTPAGQDSSVKVTASRDEITAITVPYDKALLSLEFTALEYSAPERISYAYYMEGSDREWVYAKDRRTATYNHVPEGSYTFRVKCTNAEGVWNKEGITLKILVLPPWYRTWWAYSFYFMMVAAAIYVYNLYRERQTTLKYEVALAKLNTEKERAEREIERTQLEKTQVEFEKTQALYQMEKAERETERVVNEKEKEINEKRLSFFTNISHEFRTPLTLIINPVKDLIDQDKSSSDMEDKEELNIVYRNARRMLSLVDQLLLFRKAESGMDKLRTSNLNFYKLCREVYLCFVQLAKAKNIRYQFHSENEALEIYADRQKMEIILYNLLSNALKYTPAHGSIDFKIDETETDVTVSIADSGDGIPKEVGASLFEKFSQAEAKGSVVKPGFGIGLFLVKNFIEAHKGYVRYESEVGSGTTFTISMKKGKAHFGAEQLIGYESGEMGLLSEINTADNYLPATEFKATAPVLPGSLTLSAEFVTEKKTVLIVDDDAQIRLYVSSIFSAGFTCYEAESGEDGLKLATGCLPDIIISDIKMHGISGIDLCKIIKENPTTSHIPIILLTGNSSDDQELVSIQKGADDYITKPFEKELLIARVSTLLKNRNNLQKYFFNEITLNKNDLKVSREYKEFLEKCISIVESHIADENFSIKILLAEMGMSHSNLFRRVKSISGQSINVFIRFIRLRKAAELFINSNYNVNEVAFMVGIGNAQYFREQFNKVFDMNPSDYIKKYRNTFANQFTLNSKLIQSGKERKN